MPPNAELQAAVEEFRQLKHVMKKVLACIMIGCLIIIKLSYIATIMRFYKILIGIATFFIYLCLAGIAFLLPMYYTAAAVEGYQLYLICAAGSLIVEAAQFFLFLGVFEEGGWMLLELVTFCCLLLALTLIESLFKDKEFDEGEDIPLSESVNSRYNHDIETQTAIEDAALTETYELAIWKGIRFGMWRNRSI